tara:strand:- start:1436 stop:1993 length:558 start_codon:yes stop_codon:yes gene_type:complete
MKLELLILAITGFMIFNVYSDGKYLKMINSYNKYFKMVSYGFVGLSAYLFLKKYPTQSQSVLGHVTDIVKYMPMAKSSTDYLTPFFDFTNLQTLNPQQNQFQQPQMEQRILQSGKGATKRSVSETKKKFVAAQQNWCCNNCKQQLPAWFEVDHITRLDQGGDNHVDNLVALCRDCHGRKTAMENL